MAHGRLIEDGQNHEVLALFHPRWPFREPAVVVERSRRSGSLDRLPAFSEGSVSDPIQFLGSYWPGEAVQSAADVLNAAQETGGDSVIADVTIRCDAETEAAGDVSHHRDVDERYGHPADAAAPSSQACQFVREFTKGDPDVDGPGHAGFVARSGSPGAGCEPGAWRASQDLAAFHGRSQRS